MICMDICLKLYKRWMYDLTGSEVKLFLVLLCKLNGTSGPQPISMKELVASTGMCHQGIKRARKTLRDKSIIDYRQDSNEAGVTLRNRYEIKDF